MRPEFVCHNPCHKLSSSFGEWDRDKKIRTKGERAGNDIYLCMIRIRRVYVSVKYSLSAL